MTAKEAFAQAFDEAFVMDALPSMGLGRKNPNPAASGIQKDPAKASSMGGSSGSGASKSRETMTLAEHDAENHPEGYKGGRCSWRDAYGMSGMSLEEAQRKGLADKKFPAQGGEGLESGKGDVPESTPEMIDQNVEQISENLQMADTVRNDLLPNGPEVIETEGGKVKVQDVVQKGIVEGVNNQLQEAKESGDVKKEQAATETLETLSSVSEPLADDSKGSQGVERQSGEDVGQTEQASTQPAPAQTIMTSEGKSYREIEPDEAMVLAANPEKKEIFQKMVDLEGMVGDLEEDSPEFKDLANQYQALQRMFFGNEGMGDISSESPSGKGGAPAHQGTPTPSDSEFQIGENKYKVGGTVYTDVSGKGLLTGMLSAFMAGIRGESIITGWDKISGEWDQIKRSAAGENVRDGIAGALIQNTIANYAAKEGLSDDAKMELAVIQDMVSQAKSPKDNMAAVKLFQAWKEKYSKELGELEKPKPGEAFQPLPNDYKGGTPPTSILTKSHETESDTAYGEEVAEGLVNHMMQFMGLPVEGISNVSVGPEASTIKLKVSPLFDLGKMQSEKTLTNISLAIGAKIVGVEAVKGEKGQIAVTVQNPEMRPVGFTEIAESKEWKDFSEQASIPMIVGKDSTGKNVMKDIAKMPHMIVTGASGTGKSVFVKSVMSSIQMAKTPKQVRMVVLDPKNEFRTIEGSPHLLYPRAGGATDPDKKAEDIANVVASLKKEMEERIAKIGGVIKDFDPSKNEYQGDSEANILEYNKANPGAEMPHVVMIFDEFANISKNHQFGKQIQEDIDQLTALGRSVGINCMLITQRDDKDSIPHKIQSNAPGRVHFKAAPGDTKAGKEYQELAGDGAYIMTDGQGHTTRGRGSFISKKDFAAIPAYYRDHMSGSPADTGAGSGTESPKLPQGHLDAITAAVQKGNPISMVAAEGYMDAFKNAFPSDWEITEVDVNGEKNWKATPPSKKAGGTEGSPSKPKLKEGFTSVPPSAGSPEFSAIIKDAKGKTVGGIHKDGSRIDYTKGGTRLEDGEKAPWESGEESPASEEPKKKIEKLDDLDQSFNPTDVESMKSYRDRITDAINQLSNVTIKGKKESDALEKKLKPFKEEREWIESKIKENFPDEAYQEGETIDNNDVLESTEQTSASETDGGNISSPKPESKQKMAFVERRFERKRKELEKAQDQETNDAKASLIDDELAALTKKYEDAKAKYESGGSPEDVLKAFTGEKTTSAEQVGSETTANGESNDNNSETTPPNNEEDEKKLAEKRELAPKAFRPKHGYQALTDKQIKEVTSVIPDDWEIETDNELGKPAEHETGYVFVRNPKTGSYGHVELKGKKKNGSVGPVWTPEVKTTDDMFEGETRDEKGKVKLGPKAQAARNAKIKILELENTATRNGTSLAEEIIKYTQSPQYKGEIPNELLQRAKDGEELDWQEESNRYNTLEKRHRTGMDKAPDNMTIVANAVANVLEKMEKRI